MSCTTLLVGKEASYDGSTLIARNEDCDASGFNPKRFVMVRAEDQPRHYRSVHSHLELDLPDNPLRYSTTPEAREENGIWAAHGINEANVAMTATETITSNERVLAADPLVELVKAEGKEGEEGYRPEIPGGIGEEDMVTLTLPYVHSAREGVKRLGALLEKYGTYESNGIAFSDQDEVWYLESIGGHHWMARRVPDNAYVALPNQLSIDSFDFEDARGAQKDCLCSEDLEDFVEENHLNLSLDKDFDPRLAFGSHSDQDHIYNTPRAWIIQGYFNPHCCKKEEGFPRPAEADDIPWARVAERKITVEDIKTVLSNHYQGTAYDPYEEKSTPYRPIGVNRTNVMSILQIRPYCPPACRSIQWIAYGSGVYSAITPYYSNVMDTPAYLRETPPYLPSTSSSYWTNRLIAALADPIFHKAMPLIKGYQLKVQSTSQQYIRETDQRVREEKLDGKDLLPVLEGCNQKVADLLQEESSKTLAKVLDESSFRMKNAFSLSD